MNTTSPFCLGFHDSNNCLRESPCARGQPLGGAVAARRALLYRDESIHTTLNCSCNIRNSDKCSRSQGQENSVTLLLAGKDRTPLHNGVFLELGGADGLAQSNTYHLERCLGWSGIMLEANPSQMDMLCRNRPGVVSVGGLGVCALPETHLEFAVPLKKGLSAGAVATLSPEANRSHLRDRRGSRLRLPCAPLSAFLQDVHHLDYLSLDLEGGEAVALGSIDWRELSVHAISVEQSSAAFDRSVAVRSLLSARGFVLVATVHVWRGHIADEIFANASFLLANDWRLSRTAYRAGVFNRSDRRGERRWGKWPWDQSVRLEVLSQLAFKARAWYLYEPGLKLAGL